MKKSTVENVIMIMKSCGIFVDYKSSTRNHATLFLDHKPIITYRARLPLDKTTVDLFYFSHFCLWSNLEGKRYQIIFKNTIFSSLIDHEQKSEKWNKSTAVFLRNNRFLRNSGPLKIRLIQCYVVLYVVLWIPNIEYINTRNVSLNVNYRHIQIFCDVS